MKINKGDILLGLYKVTEDPITIGGSSLVWKVHHIKWDIDMALKQPTDDIAGSIANMEQFEHECMLWASLGMHPNIVTCYYVRRISGTPMIFSEWCGGGSLSDRIEDGTLAADSSRIPYIAADIMKGLYYAHNCRQKIIHKDIKPRNIMLTDDWTAKITDFGSTTVTTDPTTERYMSPEHTLLTSDLAQYGASELTSASDIYSWAVTVLEMYLGKETWKLGKRPQNILRKPAAVKVIPGEMIGLLDRCLRKDPRDRPDETEILKCLGEIIGNASVTVVTRESLFESADSLNNRALSMLDLGLGDKSAECWREALRVSPRHALSLYNYSLFRWKNGLIDDEALYTVLRDISDDEKAVKKQIKELDKSRKVVCSIEVPDEYSIPPAEDDGEPVTHQAPVLRFGKMDRRFVLYVEYINEKCRLYDAKSGELILECETAGFDDSGIEWMPDGMPAVLEKKRDTGSGVSEYKYNSLLFELDKVNVFVYEDCCNAFFDLIVHISGKNGGYDREFRFTPFSGPAAIYGAGHSIYAAMYVNVGEYIQIVSISLEDRAEYLFSMVDTAEVIGRYTEMYTALCDKLRRRGTYSAKGKVINRMMNLPDLGRRRETFALRRVIADKAGYGESQISQAVWYEHLDCAYKVAISASGRFTAAVTEDESSPLDLMLYLVDLEKNEARYVCIERGMYISKVAFIHDHVIAIWFFDSEYLFIADEESSVPTYMMYFDPISNFVSDKIRVSQIPEDENGGQPADDAINSFMHERDYFCWAVDDYKQYVAAIKKNGEFSVYSLNTVLDGLSGEQVSDGDDERLRRILDGEEEQTEGYSREWLNEQISSATHAENKLARMSGDIIDDLSEPEEETEYDDDFDFDDDYDYDDEPEEETNKQKQENLAEIARSVNDLRRELHERIKGQDHAVDEFCDGIFNAYAGSGSDPERKRPRAVFTFAGSPGCGKTLMAKTAARVLFGKEPLFFSMTDYSGPQSHEGLIGISSFYKSSQPGKLTMAVLQDPDNILVIDEIEKADENVIMLFYQMLDEGRLVDASLSGRYAKSGERDSEEMGELIRKTKGVVSFENTIIIFTTNVGRDLYESSSAMNSALIPKSTLINALATETDPITGKPFFPTAFVSRLSTGYPILFNRLTPDALISIAHRNFTLCAEAVERKWGISCTADNDVYAALLYSEGGRVDGRRFETKVDRLIPANLRSVLPFAENHDISRVRFSVSMKDAPAQAAALFDPEKSRTRVLVYADTEFSDKLRKAGGESFNFLCSDRVSDILELAKNSEPDLALIDISMKSSDAKEDNGMVTVAGRTVAASPSARKWRFGKTLFEELAEICPWLPLYMLEPVDQSYGGELISYFMKNGARDLIKEPAGDEELSAMSQALMTARKNTYMIAQAEKLSSTSKSLAFDCSPVITENGVNIRLERLRLIASPPAEDIRLAVSAAERPTDRMDDVVGLDGAKNELRGLIRYLKDPRGYAAKGYPVPKGVLLYGSPGTGKTMLARAVAGECGVTFIAKSSGEFASAYNGVGAEKIRGIFESARRNAPAIIFIDEIDTIAAQRSAGSHNDTLNELLAQMDGFKVDLKRPVVLIAATNYGIEPGDGGIGVIDEALRRRFSRCVKVEQPDLNARKELFTVLLGKICGCTVDDAEITAAAEQTAGVSPAIIKKMVEKAMWNALDNDRPLDNELLDEAVLSELYGSVSELTVDEVRSTAIHECGHALMYYINHGSAPAYVTAVSRSNYGGYMLPAENARKKAYYTGDDLRARIRELLGGRAAEIVFLGESSGITTGVADDLKRATAIAEDYIMRYGMDTVVGMAVRGKSSDEIIARVNAMLAEEMENTISVIESHREKVQELADKLIGKKYLNAGNIESVLKDIV
ncbi:MAG: AAA family ATPase [Ruminiclostridium sp.]|nr:AAA family ATPase [Ruminiclostridium sp.]